MRHFQYSVPQPIQPKLNELPNQRRANTSQYRTHFTLMNVYCPTSVNYDQYVIEMAQKLRKYINCDIIQISQIVNENRVDLSIGMQSDKDAMIFLLKNEDIKIITDKFGEQSYKPIVSNVFKIYMNSKKHLYAQLMAEQQKSQAPKKPVDEINITLSPKIIKQQNPHETQVKSNHSESGSYSSSSYSRSESDSQSSRKKGNNSIQKHKRSQGHERERSRSREKGFSQSYSHHSKQVPNIYEICIFCIPLEYDERDVQTRLKQRKIYTHYNSFWKMSEDMQYLEFKLQRPLSPEAVNSIDLKISNYPCIVMPKQKSEAELRQEIRRYQSQLISQNPIDENALLACLYDVGGAVSVIKDDYNDEEKYIITFNMLSKVQKFEKKCKEVFGPSIQLGYPENHIRMCRVQKMFSIVHIINDYAQKLRKHL